MFLVFKRHRLFRFEAAEQVGKYLINKGSRGSCSTWQRRLLGSSVHLVGDFMAFLSNVGASGGLYPALSISVAMPSSHVQIEKTYEKRTDSEAG